jgi:hypothetical protein
VLLGIFLRYALSWNSQISISCIILVTNKDIPCCCTYVLIHSF